MSRRNIPATFRRKRQMRNRALSDTILCVAPDVRLEYTPRTTHRVARMSRKRYLSANSIRAGHTRSCGPATSLWPVKVGECPWDVRYPGTSSNHFLMPDKSVYRSPLIVNEAPGLANSMRPLYSVAARLVASSGVRKRPTCVTINRPAFAAVAVRPVSSGV